MKRYAAYRTASAPASRKTGALALALAVVASLAMRFGLVGSDIFLLSLTAAALIAFLSLVLSLFGLHRIWTYGGPGVPAALTGAFLAVLALVPPGLIVSVLVTNGGSGDLSTNRLDPPELKLETVAGEEPFLTWLNTAVSEHVQPAVTVLAGNKANTAGVGLLDPDIVPRRYRISTAQLHAAGAKALESLNWKVVDELPPDLLDAQTHLQAEGISRILGLKHDIVLRIRPDPVGALLDVRSRSRAPLPDLSDDADRIRIVLAEIDRVLLETYGDLARLSVEETLEEDELTVETPQEPRETIPLPGFKPYVEDEDAPVADDLTDLEG
ncbi:DUF1499 domain-containing protein [Roseibium sp. M-1]